MKIYYYLYLVFVLLLIPGASHAKERFDFQIESIFLINFPQYVTWSNQKLQRVLCTMGNDPFKSYLETLTVENPGYANIVIKRRITLNEIKNCDILYISTDQVTELKTILLRTNNAPILTVSKIERFVNKGGIIGFININNNVRLEINYKKAKNSGLEINAELLKIALRIIY